MHDVLDSPWGRLFRQLGARRRRRPAAIRVIPDDGAEIKRTGLRALGQSLGILATCIKEAPEFAQPATARHDAGTGQVEVRSSIESDRAGTYGRFQRPVRFGGRRADHAADPRADPREARRRLHRGRDPATGERRSSRSSSIRAASAPIWSSSSAGSASSSPSRRTTSSRTRRCTRRIAASLRMIRRLLQPDPEAVLQPESAHPRAAHAGADQRRVRPALPPARGDGPLYYEVIHNLVVEITRLGIEVHNLKMRVESLSSRMDFDERRGRVARRRRRSTGQPQRRAGQQRSRASAARRSRHGGPGEPAPSRRSRPQRQPAPQVRRAGAAAGQGAAAAQRPRRQTRPEPARSAGAAGDGGGAGRQAPATADRRGAGADGVGGPRPGMAGRVSRLHRVRRRADGRRRRRRTPTTDGAGRRPDDDGDDGAADRSVKLAVVVQRYGADISGGAELHARYIAERLARHADVEVLTTCASDYITLAERAAGRRRDGQRRHGAAVSRVARRATPTTSAAGRSWCSSSRTRSPTSCAWLDERRADEPGARSGTSGASRDEFDFFVFFSYRYYHAWHGARAVPDKAVLVPTAERDPAIGLGDLRARVPRRARAHVQLARGARADSGRQPAGRCPGVVVGVGSEIPERTQPWRFRKKFNVKRPFAIYIGRIDENKGCKELFAFFERYAVMYPHGLDLVLVGSSVLPIPEAPADPASRLPVRRGQVRRARGRRRADHAVARTRACRWSRSKPGRSASRCWPTAAATCCAASACAATRGLYYETFEEFAEALYALEGGGPARRGPRPQRPRVLPAALHVAGDRAEVPRHVRSAEARAARRAAWSRCRAGSRAGGATLPPGARGRRRRARRARC